MGDIRPNDKSDAAQLKSEYVALVEREFERLQAALTEKLQHWLIPSQGLIVEYDALKYRLIHATMKDLSREDECLRNAWEDIKRGMRYIGGIRTLELGYRAGIAPMPPTDEPTCSRVDEGLRSVHVRAEAAHKYLQWLESQLECIDSESFSASSHETEDTATEPAPPTQGREGGKGAEIEIERLEGIRESVAGILDPLNVAFLSTQGFEEAINRLCKYFNGEEQQAVKCLKVRKGNAKKLGKALGEIHRDVKHRDAISRDYLQFAKDTFDCFEGQDISHEKLTSTTLYKYMTGKG